MAASVTVVRRSVFGDRRANVCDVTFDAAYPAGGEPVTPAQFGLTVVDTVVAETAVATTGRATALVVAYDRSGELLQAFETGAVVSTPLDEVGAVDLSDYTVRLTVIGH